MSDIVRDIARAVAFTPISGADDTPAAPIVYELTTPIQNYYKPMDVSSYPGTGTVVTDIGAAAVAGTNLNLANGATVTGGFMSFDGDNDSAISVSSTGIMQYGTDITVCVWFKPSRITAFDPIISKRDSAGTEGYELVNGSGQLRLTLYDTANYNVYGPALVADTWYFAAFACSGTTLSVHLNDSWHSDRTATNVPDFSSNTSFWLAQREADFNNDYGGLIGEVMIYNTALTTPQITANYHATKANYGIA